MFSFWLLFVRYSLSTIAKFSYLRKISIFTNVIFQDLKKVYFLVFFLILLFCLFCFLFIILHIFLSLHFFCIFFLFLFFFPIVDKLFRLSQITHIQSTLFLPEHSCHLNCVNPSISVTMHIYIKIFAKKTFPMIKE